jgi:hypothetical protein
MEIKVLNSDRTERLGNRLWVLTHPFAFTVNGKLYIIPKGTVTDGASCPRLFWFICSPIAGPFGQPSIIHDWLYNEGPDLTQKTADRIFYLLSRKKGAGFFRAQLVKIALKSFGHLSYKKTGTVNKINQKTCYDTKYAIQRVKELCGSKHRTQLR